MTSYSKNINETSCSTKSNDNDGNNRNRRNQRISPILNQHNFIDLTTENDVTPMECNTNNIHSISINSIASPIEKKQQKQISGPIDKFVLHKTNKQNDRNDNKPNTSNIINNNYCNERINNKDKQSNCIITFKAKINHIPINDEDETTIQILRLVREIDDVQFINYNENLLNIKNDYTLKNYLYSNAVLKKCLDYDYHNGIFIHDEEKQLLMAFGDQKWYNYFNMKIRNNSKHKNDDIHGVYVKRSIQKYHVITGLCNDYNDDDNKNHDEFGLDILVNDIQIALALRRLFIRLFLINEYYYYENVKFSAFDINYIEDDDDDDDERIKNEVLRSIFLNNITSCPEECTIKFT